MSNKILFIFSILFGSCICAQTGGAIFGASGNGAISRNGKYVSAVIDKSSNQQNPVLVIQSTASNWKKEIPSGSLGTFSDDSKYCYYKVKDSFCIVDLKSHELQVIKNVSSWKKPNNCIANIVAFQLNTSGKNLILLQLDSKKESSYENVNDYAFDTKGNVLLLQTQLNAVQQLDWIDIGSGHKKIIWTGQEKLVDFDLDTTGERLAFIVNSKNTESGKESTSIWFYKKGIEKADKLIENGDNSIRGLDIFLGQAIGGRERTTTIELSPGGKQILFYYLERQFTPEKRPSVNLTYVDAFKENLDFDKANQVDQIDIWSYLDSRLAPDKLNIAAIRRRYAVTVNTDSRRVSEVELDNHDVIVRGHYDAQFNDDFILIYHFPFDFLSFGYMYNNNKRGGYAGYSMNEFDWNKSLCPEVFLVSLVDGSRKLITKGNRPVCIDAPPTYFMSPDAKYVVYYDSEKLTYLSYEILSGKTHAICEKMKVNFVMGKGDNSALRDAGQPNACSWLKKQSKFYLLTTDIDGDVWQVDVSGQQRPINLTNGFAKRHSLHLKTGAFDTKTNVFFKPTDKILLQTHKHSFVYDGFYSKELSGRDDPICLVPENGPNFYSDFWYSPLASIFLVKRHNSTSAPSFYTTSHFKSFEPVTSDVQEQRQLVKKELLTWKSFDGDIVQGVLYKPRDFDPGKKYPVIVTYYDWSSAQGGYQEPSLYREESSILNFLPNEGFLKERYLVFCPAINYKLGELGPSVYNSIVPGVKLLMKKPYVNAKKVGIFGNSFGGYETNYLVTHTNIFAAAAVGVGVSNMIGEYTEFPGVRTNAASSVFGQHGMGSTPWQRPDLFLENSPVLYADKVTTPLLMGYGVNDDNIQFSHGVSMYIALRRLGKPSWLLCSGMAHYALFSESGSFYMKQFFDHYLKDAAAPRWMLEEIPAREQGSAKWRELDSTGRTPQVGGVRYENETVLPEQVPLLKHKTRVTNNGRIEDVSDKPKKVKRKNK